MLSYERGDSYHLPLRRPPPGRHARWVSRKPVSFNRGRELKRTKPEQLAPRRVWQVLHSACHRLTSQGAVECTSRTWFAVYSIRRYSYVYILRPRSKFVTTFRPRRLPGPPIRPRFLPLLTPPSGVHKRAVHRLLRSVGGSQRQGGIPNLNQFTST